MQLELSNITKYYGKLKANDDVSFQLKSGEVLAIVGENGAGKSTIMKILYGLESASSGEIRRDGKVLHIKNPSDAIRQGIGMVQQNFMLFPSFSVSENIVYNLEPTKGLFFDLAEAKRRTEELSAKHGLPIDPDAKISELSVGLQQRVEILKVLYQNADVLIFDEPTAVLTPNEIEELLQSIRHLADSGKACVLITHKLAEVKAVADRVVVMRKGQKVGELQKEEIDIPSLSRLMIGRVLNTRTLPKKEAGETILELKHLNKRLQGAQVLDDLNLEVRAGEIVGIAGISGNGQSKLLDCLSGMDQLDSGEILLEGQHLENLSAEAIRKLNFAYVPEDRLAMGSAPQADLAENSIVAYHRQDRFCQRGLLKKSAISDFVQKLLERYKVAYSGLDQKAGELSGGNLQKLIVARELERGTKAIVVAEPTRGVDIGAMEFIHDTLVEKRNEGAGILLISSELSEIMDLSDRICVLYQGHIVAEFKRGEIEAADLGEYMLGTKRQH